MARLHQKAYSRLNLLSFHSFGLYILCAPGAYSAYYSRPSNNHWVFWYYAGSGNRECGNICIITFAIVCVLLLLLIYRIYSFCRSSHWEKKLESIDITENGTATAAGEKFRLSSSSESRIEQGYGVNNKKKSNGTSDFLEYADAGPVAPPPVYSDSYSIPAATPSYSMSSMSSTAPLLPSKFAAENPPHDLPPLREHVASILSNGAAEAYKLAPIDELIERNLLKVDSDGTTAIFNGTRVSCQSNYPFLVIKKSDFANDDENSLYPPSQTPSSSPLPQNLATSPSHPFSSTTNSYYDATNITYPMPAPQTEVKISIPPSSLSTIAELPNSPVELTTPTNEQSGLLKKEIKKLKEKESLSETDTDKEGNTKGELCYFEMTVLENDGKNNTIAVGVATQPYPWSSLNTSGYAHVSSYTSISYSNAWGDVGDTVGCGYYPKTGEVFFTINGSKHQAAYTGPQHIWYPCIGADGRCKVSVNFGKENGDTFVFGEARGSGSVVVID
ncbi:6571_t:CDS:2 [Paraglomus brasilianum]|uniref:6571_t:CDS:1 n=1 Tax=Paraglomus brasilianum TaxID=144538 RepID=A0A9N9AAG7_9GLOM|nr:6571_t:CDS:2 [Paraglomus brasilianum]